MWTSLQCLPRPGHWATNTVQEIEAARLHAIMGKPSKATWVSKPYRRITKATAVTRPHPSEGQAAAPDSQRLIWRAIRKAWLGFALFIPHTFSPPPMIVFKDQWHQSPLFPFWLHPKRMLQEPLTAAFCNLLDRWRPTRGGASFSSSSLEGLPQGRRSCRFCWARLWTAPLESPQCVVQFR